MKIAVTGKDGQVVTALVEAGPNAGVEIVAIGRPVLDLADPATVVPALARARPDVIVSAAAYTAVDKAESEPDLAFAINGAGAGVVAEAAGTLGVPVIHLSTDYVFDGSKPTAYVETDPTGPLSVYGASKLEGERLVAAATPDHVILRCAWVYSPFGTNFLKTMLRLAETRDHLRVVADQHGRPTSAQDIAEAVIAIAKRLKADADPALRGIFHLASTGEAVWAQFADEIFKAASKAVTVEAITTADYPTLARRPANSRLDGAKLAETYGIVLSDWRQSAAVVVDRLMKGPR